MLSSVKWLAGKQGNKRSQQVAELLRDPSRHRIELTCLVRRLTNEFNYFVTSAEFHCSMSVAWINIRSCQGSPTKPIPPLVSVWIYDSCLVNVMGVMSALSLITCIPNLKSLALTVLELLAFNPQKLGVTWPWPRPFLKKNSGIMLYCPKNLHTKFEVYSFNRSINQSINKFFGWPK